jgi:hypothetical protein
MVSAQLHRAAGSFKEAAEKQRTGPDQLINLKKTAEFDRLIEICSVNIASKPDDHKALMIRASSFMKKGSVRTSVLRLQIIYDFSSFEHHGLL